MASTIVMAAPTEKDIQEAGIDPDNEDQMLRLFQEVNAVHFVPIDIDQLGLELAELKWDADLFQKYRDYPLIYPDDPFQYSIRE